MDVFIYYSLFLTGWHIFFFLGNGIKVPKFKEIFFFNFYYFKISYPIKGFQISDLISLD